MSSTPPLKRYTLVNRTTSLVELVEVLDQLPFLDWTIRSDGNYLNADTEIEVEITFNQVCQPVTIDGEGVT